MTQNITIDDKEKSVVLADGTQTGTISGIQDGQVWVIPNENADLAEVVKSALGCNDTDDAHDLRSDDVETIADEKFVSATDRFWDFVAQQRSRFSGVRSAENRDSAKLPYSSIMIP